MEVHRSIQFTRNGRGDRIVGTIKTALKKMYAGNSSYLDAKLPQMFCGYGLRHNAEDASPFECMFGVRLRPCWERKAYMSTPQNASTMRHVEHSNASNISANRIAPYEGSHSALFPVCSWVLLRLGTEPSGSKYKSFMWTGTHEIIEANHPMY